MPEGAAGISLRAWLPIASLHTDGDWQGFAQVREARQ